MNLRSDKIMHKSVLKANLVKRKKKNFLRFPYLILRRYNRVVLNTATITHKRIKKGNLSYYFENIQQCTICTSMVNCRTNCTCC